MLGRRMAASLAPTQFMRQGFVPDAFMDRLHMHIISTVRACRLYICWLLCVQFGT